MKRKILLSLLFACIFIFMFAAMTVSAYDGIKYGDLYYKIENGEATITDCTYSATKIVIPSEINGYPVTSIGRMAFRDCTRLKSVTIPDGVTNIGDYAFCFGMTFFSFGIGGDTDYYIADIYDKVSPLTSVTIPSSVTFIGIGAFAGCNSLTSITIPDGVTSIGDYAFSGCSNLTSITIPDSVTDIGYAPFGSCTSLTSINVDANNTKYCSIDGNLFNKDKTELIKYAIGKTDTHYDIPAGVTSINYNAFRGCTSLTSVTIPDSVTNIGACAFSDCTSLKSITIPGNVTSIGYSAFSYCTSLKSITIPGNVTSIGNEAFRNCTSLQSITIPDSVTSIGYEAFSGCTSLTSVTIPAGVTGIESSAFSYCTSLQSINVDANNANYCSIDGNLFTKDKKTLVQYAIGKSDTHYDIPAGVTSIGIYAFFDCTSLTTITIPDSVRSIYGNFRNCTSLTSINVDANNANYCSIDGNLFTKDKKTLVQYAIGKSDTHYDIPAGVTSIRYSAFSGCTSLQSITIPDSVTSIGMSAFYDCTSLQSVTIPDSVTEIGFDAFSWCESLKSITIPDSVTSIGDWAFCYCESLKSITIPDSVTEIGIDAFQNCSSLTSVTIGNGVTSIDGYVFSDCTSLKNITIPAGVTSIGNEAFRNCTSLQSITIPDSVTSIGYFAFDDCNNLSEVYYNGTDAKWDEIDIGSFNEPLLNVMKKSIHYVKLIDANGSQGSITCQPGTKITLSEIEKKYKHKVTIYTDAEMTQEFDLSTSIGENMTLYIKLGEEITYIPGDLDGEEGVNDGDVIYLMYHIFFPEDYPVDQVCDFNGDGTVDDGDVIYLMYYIFFPDDYPLK